ncbi:MAG: DnaD domain protein [Dehalococcoidia bacterium]|nr:DnaD domain protein [Dehalococcoidia bacterium]
MAIPRVFFSDLLPRIDDVAELQVTLHFFRLLGGRRGYPRAVGAAELLGDRTLAATFTAMGRDFRSEGERGLTAATGRGTLLQAVAPEGTIWLLLNAPQDRRAADGIQQGRVRPAGVAGANVVADHEPAPLPQQDIFSLYEANIGLLTPIIAERLQEAEQEYPAGWIAEAFQIAAVANQPRWRYVEAVLQRWKVEGKDDGKSGGHSKAARRPADYSLWLPASQRKR